MLIKFIKLFLLISTLVSYSIASKADEKIKIAIIEPMSGPLAKGPDIGSIIAILIFSSAFDAIE